MAIPLPLWKGPDTARFPQTLVATAESGSWRLAERVFYVLEYEGMFSQAQAFGLLFPRATIYTIFGLTGYFWVEETTINPQKGGRARVRTTFAWMGQAPPPEWSITPFEINPPIIRSPFFASLSATEIQAVYTQFQRVTQEGLVELQAVIAANPDANLLNNLLTKWVQGKETFYQAGLKYVWTQYYTTWSGQTRRGGYREQPRLSVDGVGPGATICPFVNWDWIRDADEMVWSNGLYKVTRSWTGAFNGLWDTDLYGTTPQ